MLDLHQLYSSLCINNRLRVEFQIMDSPKADTKIPENIKLFVFDWSGTLFNDINAVLEANNIMLVKRGLPELDYAEWRQSKCANLYDFGYKYGLLVRQDTPNTENENRLFTEFTESYCKAKQTVNEGDAYYGAPELIRELHDRKYKVCIVSSAPEKGLMSDIETSKAFDLSMFHMIIAGTHKKAEALTKVSSFFNIDPKNSLYIGDCMQDVQAARQAKYGVCMAVSQGYQTEEQLLSVNPDILIQAIWEMRAILPPHM